MGIIIMIISVTRYSDGNIFDCLISTLAELYDIWRAGYWQRFPWHFPDILIAANITIGIDTQNNLFLYWELSWLCIKIRVSFQFVCRLNIVSKVMFYCIFTTHVGRIPTKIIIWLDSLAILTAFYEKKSLN